MIRRLFPAARQHIENYTYGAESKKEWLRERRVAHEDILQLYLERYPCDHFKAYLYTEKALQFMNNRKKFAIYLETSGKSEIVDVITALGDFEDQFKSESVVPASIVLLNLMYTLPDNRKSLFDFSVRVKVEHIVYLLIRSLKEPDLIENAVKSILPETNTLSAKLRLINMVGHREKLGQKLVSEEAAKHLEDIWVNEVKAASDEILKKEPDLLRVLLWAKRFLAENGEQLVICDSSELSLAILKSSQTETMSQNFDSRAVQKETHLAWDALIELYGNEDILKKHIEQVKNSVFDCDANSIIELADKYKNGWRPE